MNSKPSFQAAQHRVAMLFPLNLCPTLVTSRPWITLYATPATCPSQLSLYLALLALPQI